MDTGTVIRAKDLVKRFGPFTALTGLDMEVAAGEVHGFLGPNGSGKSTTIRVLLGLLRASGGLVEVFGGDPWRDAVALHRRIAYVPGDVALWPDLSGGETIDLLGSLRGGLDQRRRAGLIERFELDPTKRGRQYSKGNRQKVAIVAALASDADLLILDEPTSGLDPLMEAVFQSEIAAERARGRTVLLSSHILSEVEALADRVSIIRQGRIISSGTLTELRGSTRTHVRARLGRLPAELSALPLEDPSVDANGVLSAAVEADRIAEAMAALVPLGIAELEVSPASLEDLFLHQYEEAAGHAGGSL
ncbi:ABC transporter ATP-binding protein [Propionibacterium australiense]|uniref:ABC transporter n=1 Tax=Propionibacterium australiense TaxID=119981 RepID=A0A383S9S5_9ACTN|nr:ABC transporter ATP-binding protein [Propionibacterium australiense]RLP11078.1 ATP-binding cassette domain-containing protein [Propionibacterium australiense]RLP12402.1 ATP-binding cassette domain-containing protein [Propionibacterium australiense]SYZ34006.1 ABC transporter [Propionibacterium australiense]VEH91340.1 Daunorubicin/doxorubicin resistance ATP-binding protein DrrA [Propionibacterium australiense]